MAICGGILFVGATLGWAGATVFAPAQDVLDSSEFTAVEVVDGIVGSSIDLNTVAEWKPQPAGANLASGVVTTVNILPGTAASQGTVLYSVNLRPVVIAEGAIPSFRFLSLNSHGADVKQLQSMLAALNHFDGVADGNFGKRTDTAVRSWQRSLEIEQDGVIQAGDVIFVPHLPSQVALDNDVIHSGATLTGGEQAINGLPAAPTFEIPVTDAQSARIPTGVTVRISSAGSVWEAMVADRTTDPAEGVRLRLAPKSGDVICATECGLIPVTGPVLLQSKIVTVEDVAGPMIPSAALLTTANGKLLVTGIDGDKYPVDVLGSARGMSVVDGVPLGTMVRVPASSK